MMICVIRRLIYRYVALCCRRLGDIETQDLMNDMLLIEYIHNSKDVLYIGDMPGTLCDKTHVIMHLRMGDDDD